jgi:ubiquinone/menaquinone biosynthesis C-methylase UbiE
MPNGVKRAYPIDVENISEAARLRRQGHILDEALGLFPPGITPAPHAQILDLACGPGTWSMNVARSYPASEVMGADVSRAMIRRAAEQAHGHRLKNCVFQLLNIMDRPLPLPTDTFDIIHVRLIFSFQAPTSWVPLFQECLRLLKPGGVLLSTEVDILMDYAPHVERYLSLIYKKMRAEGRLYPAIGCHTGILPMHTSLLAEAGFSDVQRRIIGVDQGYATPLYEGSVQDLLSLMKYIQPYLAKGPHATAQDDLDGLLATCKQEFAHPSYRALGLYQTVWGTKR